MKCVVKYAMLNVVIIITGVFYQAVLAIVCSLLKLGIQGCDRTQRPMVKNP